MTEELLDIEETEEEATDNELNKIEREAAEADMRGDQTEYGIDYDMDNILSDMEDMEDIGGYI